MLLPLGLPAATNDLTSVLQRGLFEEEANHNLEAAAQAYQAVSARFDQDRKLAATAIFRLGEVYRKQGKTNEATAQYERIVREFSDQPTLVTLSRQNLGSLKHTPALGDLPTVTGPREAPAPDAALLERIKKLSLTEARQVLPSLVPDELLTKLLAQYQATELKRTQPTANGLRDNTLDDQLKVLSEQIKERIEGIIKALEIRVAAVDGQPGSGGTTASSARADDEESEIRRIQAMIQNSPDLINARGEGANGNLTPLGQVASRGQLRVAKFLLDSGAALDGRSGAENWTALHFAADGGHKAMVELLLSRGADVNTPAGVQQNSPLHLAAKKGFGGVAEALLARQANVNAPDKTENTPLHAAAGVGGTAMMELLLRHEANVNAQDNAGRTPLVFAAMGGHAAVVKMLLPQANPNIVRPLRPGRPADEKALLAAKADPNAEDTSGRTPLSYAFGVNGQLEVVKLLLAAPADPNAGKLNLPLAMAAQSGHIEIAGLLLQAGAKPDLAGKTSQYVGTPGSGGQQFGNSFGPYTPLQIAVSKGDVAMAKLLFSFKADARAKDPWSTSAEPLVGWTLDKAEMLQAFLVAGADANADRSAGWPLLVHACAAGNSAATELLLAHGANANVQSQEWRTPLTYAAEKNHLKCVELLLAAKAEANVTMRDGSTALYLAAQQGAKELVEALLAHGANPNLQNQKGETALHGAVRIGKRGVEVVQLLLAKGADPNVRDNAGQTPLDWAKQLFPSGNRPAMPVAESRSGRRGPVTGPTAVAVEPQGIDLPALLRQHGALDDLPRLDRIEVRRPSVNFSAVAFQLGTNDWNEFSLLELLAGHYGLLTTERNAVWGVNNWEMSKFWQGPACQFPDLGRVIIRRPSAIAKERTELAVNVVAVLDSGDCARDVKLQPGDLVEIPEADHPVNEKWAGLGGVQLSNLLHCVARTVTISIKGTPTTVRLAPQFKLTNSMVGPSEHMQELTRGSFMLKSVLAQSRLLRASSDLSNVKVTRRAEAGGQKQEWVLNCASGSDPDLWLRDGDVIEVPDKP